MTLDVDYQRFLDKVLHGLWQRASDDASSRPAPNLVMWRSAAVEVVMQSYLDALDKRGSKPTASQHDLEMHAATVAIGQHASLAPGLLQRMSDSGRGQLRSIQLMLAPKLLTRLDRRLNEELAPEIEPVLREAWNDDALAELRSAFIEAGLVTWLVLRGEALDQSHLLLPAKNRSIRHLKT